ncbi:hypothetical protein V491_09014 [Pseudogymnoascus sp. VKM F-3775]|nr:hypothetical protein V491_09014 [Pseudogymnoascus sp. VKM F-3775]
MSSSSSFSLKIPCSARSPLKRSACDRCRMMKLRCSGSESNTRPCVRCERVDAACVTGSPKSPGRPLRSTPATTGQPRPISRRSHSETNILARDETAPTAEMPVPPTQQTGATKDAPPVDSLPSRISMGELQGEENEMVDTDMGEEQLSMLSQLDNEIPLDFGPFQIDFLSPPYNLTKPDFQGHMYTHDENTHNVMMECSGDEPISHHMGSSESNYRICRLNMHLSRQSLHLMRGSQQSSSHGISNPKGHHATVDLPYASSETTRAGEVLKNMTEFLAIIQQFASENSAAGSGESNNSMSQGLYCHYPFMCGHLSPGCSDSCCSSLSSMRSSPSSSSSSSSLRPDTARRPATETAHTGDQAPPRDVRDRSGPAN